MSDLDLAFGVIGVGVIGTSHVARLVAPETAGRLVGVADLNPDAARAKAEQYNVTAFESVDDLLASPDIEAVVVAVPSGLHRDLTKQALAAGKHVLLEKPLEITLEAADDIIHTAREAGKTVSVVSQRRFAPANQYLKNMIDTGELGKITAAAIEVPLWRSQEYYDSAGWRGTWAMDGGGALMNQGVHLVDLALWLLGDVEEVFAYTGLLAHERIEVEDTVTFTARMKSGALLTFMASTTAQGHPPIRVNVMGDQGTVVTVDEEVVHYGGENGLFPLDDIPRSDPDPGLASELMFRDQLEDFVKAAKTGSEPYVTMEAARAAVALITAVYESGRTGKPVAPKPLD